MSEYLIREINSKYEISKFDSKAYPTAIYTITTRSCSCPSFRLCKHISILKKHLKTNGATGVVYDDNANKIGQLYVQ